MATDLIGTALTTDEQDVLKLYEELKELASRDSLAPFARSSALQALGILGVVVANYGLRFEHLTDYGA